MLAVIAAAFHQASALLRVALTNHAPAHARLATAAAEKR